MDIVGNIVVHKKTKAAKKKKDCFNTEVLGIMKINQIKLKNNHVCEYLPG